MLQNHRSMFAKKLLPIPDPSKCLVDIKLAGRTHSFFMDSGFVDALQTALTSPPTNGFFECKYGRNYYAINLDVVDEVEVFEDAIKLDGGDVDGCSIWLSGKEKSIRLGLVESFESISAKLAREQEFIQIGQQHWFHKNQIALIVVQKGDEAESIEADRLKILQEACQHDWQRDGQTMMSVRWTCTKCMKTKLEG